MVIIPTLGFNVEGAIEMDWGKPKRAVPRVTMSEVRTRSSTGTRIGDACGGAVRAARIGLDEPAFGLIRPPGHHASADSAWGFCYFNNMAVALLALQRQGLIKQALVLDIDLHFGDGTVNILGDQEWVKIHNPSERSREKYIQEVAHILSGVQVDLIGVSAGFDYHIDDWGGLLATEDYFSIGTLVNQAARACGGGYFAILEGGYNHEVLGHNVAALIDGLSF